MGILRDTFIYFTSFVPRAALEAAFWKSSHPDHDDLKNACLRQADDRRLADIDDFVFSIDQGGVQKRISNIKGTFLFVDYSSVTSSINSVDVKTDLFHVAVTVARPRPQDQDQATEMLWQDAMLDILSSIRKLMRNDERLEKSTWWLQFPTTIQPWAAPGLNNTYGWTMEFDIKGIDIV